MWNIDKVRLLYDRGQPTARLVVRSRKDLDTPLVSGVTLSFSALDIDGWYAGHDTLLSTFDEPYTPKMRVILPINFITKAHSIISDLGNMGVRASMSVVGTFLVVVIAIVAQLFFSSSLSWLLVTCGVSLLVTPMDLMECVSPSLYDKCFVSSVNPSQGTLRG